MSRSTSIIRALSSIDWDFPDYSSSQYPADINSLYWYPGVFVPQIPYILIQTLSNHGELVLDPFCGGGCSAIEASRLRCHFIGVDLNPYAIKIAQAKMQAISSNEDSWYDTEKKDVSRIELVENCKDYCRTTGIESEVFKWFEQTTLRELCSLHKHIVRKRRTKGSTLRQVMFSSILNRCCSQRDHYTYITDKCFPKKMTYLPAVDKYLETLELTQQAVSEGTRQFRKIHGVDWKPVDDGILKCSDARSLGWIKDSSVDTIVTSPPYLGVNDYVRSMRLPWLFFPEDDFDRSISEEIGARRKRQRKHALEEYIEDMKMAFAEMARVLKPNGFLGLTMGQGRGKINKKNPLGTMLEILHNSHGFEILFQCERKLKFRRIQVPGVGTEKIFVLRRNRRG